MQPRQSTIEIFATFVQFDGDRFGYWAIDSRLRRSIQSGCDLHMIASQIRKILA